MKAFLCAGLGYLGFGLHSQFTGICNQARDMDSVKKETARATTISYSTPWRPQVHFTPPENWMNDPNGLFRDADGLWHLYYQYAPTLSPGDLKDWGHATSQDLYTWTNHPIAIPGTASPVYGIWSGSIVVDVDNTSGFFPNQTNGVVAIFTAYTDAQEAQALAYSTDGGYTFTFYANNPVISLNQHGFRDPKVHWHAETKKWVMVVSHANEGFIAFYTSSNLIDWTQVSTFSNPGVTGTLECPQFLEIPFRSGTTVSETQSSAPEGGHYILSMSIQSGGLNNGGIVKYFPGTFNGTVFTPADELTTRIMDFGPDSYATAFFYDLKNGPEPISMSWAVNLQYATTVPTGTVEGWVSAQSVARTHYLANISPTGYDLISEPYDLTPMIQSTVSSESKLGNGGLVIDYSSVSSGALQFLINVTSPSSTATAGNATVELDFIANSTGESVTLLFDLTTGTSSTSSPSASFSMSRNNTDAWTAAPLTTSITGVLPFTTSSSSGPSTDNYQITGILDRTILEVFLNGGMNAGTMIFFPNGPLDTASLKIAGLGDGAFVDFELLGLKSGWASLTSEGTMGRRVHREDFMDGEEGAERFDL